MAQTDTFWVRWSPPPPKPKNLKVAPRHKAVPIAIGIGMSPKGEAKLAKLGFTKISKAQWEDFYNMIFPQSSGRFEKDDGYSILNRWPLGE